MVARTAILAVCVCAAAAAAAGDAARRDRDAWQGRGQVAASTKSGKPGPAGELKRFGVAIEAHKVTVSRGEETIAGFAFKLTPATTPPAADFTHTQGAHKGRVMKGIYKLAGDELT